MLDLHLPNTVHAEGQELGEEELACGVRLLKGKSNSKIPSHFHRRVTLTKGVVEARDPHDSPEVDLFGRSCWRIMREVCSKIEQEETPQIVDHMGRRKLY